MSRVHGEDINTPLGGAGTFAGTTVDHAVGLIRGEVTMAYDEVLAARMRQLIGDDAEVTERKMFGGLAFLVDGHMAAAVSGEGGVMVRVDPDAGDALVETTGAILVEMRGRPLRGWLRVSEDQVATDEELAHWTDLAVRYTRSLT